MKENQETKPDEPSVTLNGVETTKEEVDNLVKSQTKNSTIIKESEGSYVQRLRD